MAGSSAFYPKHGAPIASSNPAVEETYDLKGLNMVAPDEIMPAGESPWTLNSRGQARNDGENRVGNRTRRGSGFFSTPVGETLNVQNVLTSTGDLTFSTTQALSQPFTATATGSLTRLDLDLKSTTGGTGHVIVEIYTDNSGFPGTMIAQGSILASSLLSTYNYLPARFIDAPVLINGTKYWYVVYIQDNGTGTYQIAQTALVTGYAALTSSTFGQYTPLLVSLQYKTYLSTTGGVLGFMYRKPSDLNNRIIFAQGTSLYVVQEGVGTPTAVSTGRNPFATYYRFEQIDDRTIYANGNEGLRQWDGTTDRAMTGIPSSTPTPSGAIAWKNRLFVWQGNLCNFSDLLNYESYPSVNFFYVPTPKSPDSITGTVVFHDNLTFFTHGTKHIIIGSDIANFTRKEAVGTKGAVRQEAICADRNFVYFMADDGQIYRWNGVSDQLISTNIQPYLQGVDPNSVRMNIYRNQLRVYFTKSPSAVQNNMVLFDIGLQQWFLDTDHQVMGALTSIDTLIEFSSTVGAVYYGEVQGSDLGKRIDWKHWTNYKTYGYRRRNGQTFGGASSKKRIKRFRPVLRAQTAPYTMLVGKDMDFNNTPDMRAYNVSSTGTTWGGGAKWGDGHLWGSKRNVQNRAGMSGRGNFIQYRFERKGVETPVELYGYTAQYKLGRQK